MTTVSMQTSFVAKPTGGLTRRSTPAKSRSALAVRAAAKREQDAPAPMAFKAFGALAAFQLALLPIAGSALADETKGTPLNNQTTGAEYGKSRANYPGLGDIKGPTPKADIGGGLDLPKTTGAATLKEIGKDVGNAVSKNSKQLSKAGDKLTGPGWMHLQ